MPTNLYFNNFNSRVEQNLYEDLINETIKQWGIDAFYMPRTSGSSIDLIYGEDPTKKFDEAYPVEVYVKNVDNFEGQELFSKFGLEIQHQMRFIVTSRSFKQRIPSRYSRPREGDLVWLTNFQALFEIKFVNQENFFYAFGSKNFYGYELVCERFRYSNENVDTGIIEIDDAIDKQVISYDFVVASGGDGAFNIGEVIYQGTTLNTSTASASVISWDLPSLTLVVKDIKGIFATNTAIHGEDSRSTFILNSINMLENSNSDFDNNFEIKTLADDILDFTEHNPFGEP